MKKTSMTLAGILAVSFTLPAMAGPDWTVIRAAQAHQAAHHQQTSQSDATQEEVLPLDHGPRAMSTPWLNKEREQYLLAQAHKKKTAFFAYHDFGRNSSHS